MNEGKREGMRDKRMKKEGAKEATRGEIWKKEG
jgi:hypothetical protein